MQAPLATSAELAFATQLLTAVLDLYDCGPHAPHMPAAVAAVLAACASHLAGCAAAPRGRLVAVAVAQLAATSAGADAAAAAWVRALAAADPGVTGATGPMPATRPGRGTFVSIPELDEDLDLNVLAGSGMESCDAPLICHSPKVKTPTPASRTLAQSMTKMLLSTGLRASRGASTRAAAAAASPRHLLNASHNGDHPATPPLPLPPLPPPPPVAGDLGTPRGGESEALARFDYDTSQTLTQFSDAEQRSLAPFALEGLEGLPPPGDNGLEGARRGGWAARAGSGPEGVASTMLSPRDKAALRRALFTALPPVPRVRWVSSLTLHWPRSLIQWAA